MTYGLYDTLDGLWMGDLEGPMLTEDHTTAQVRAQMLDVMLKRAIGRTQAKEFPGGSTRLRDTVEVVIDAETAVKMLEEGKA